MISSKIKETKGKCDQCIFGQSYTSDGNLTRICMGDFPLNTEEAHNRIIKSMEGSDCKEYEEGHKQWLKMKESGLGPCRYFVNTPPEKKYLIDRSYSDKPVYACSSGNPECLHGNNKIGCFWKLSGCTSQMRLDNPSKMADPSVLKEAFEKAGIDTSNIDYLKED